MTYQTLTTEEWKDFFAQARQAPSWTPWLWIGEGLLFMGALAPLVLLLAF